MCLQSMDAGLGFAMSLTGDLVEYVYVSDVSLGRLIYTFSHGQFDSKWNDILDQACCRISSRMIFIRMT